MENRSGLWPLRFLNFFMADLQAGVGPFLGVYLLAHGWQAGLIGTVITVGGIAGLIAGIPAGALIDATARKRTYVVVSSLLTVAASFLILAAQGFWTVAGSQIVSGVAGAALGPAVTGMTLGMVRQRHFNRQLGYNQAFNHAGNLAGAARGMHEGGERAEKASGLSVLWRCKPLLVFGICLAFFHLGNAAMLPLYGLAVVAAKQANASSFTAMTVVVAQGTMIATSLIAMKMIEGRGYWPVLLVSFIALPVRGVIAAYLINAWGVYPVQILDGIGAGLQSVATPGLIARLLDGTGRVNTGIAAAMALQGVGAALSPALGGWTAQMLGYGPCFIALGGCAAISIVLWLAFASSLRDSSRAPQTD